MLFDIYRSLLKRFGSQKWWPASNGFKPPEWEICVGAVLTQNTNWRNVEKALQNMKSEKILTTHDIINSDIKILEKLVQPSGFFRQKSKKLKELAKLVNSYKNFDEFKLNATRGQLLDVSGIGRETADSILLYVCDRPIFIVDSYTRRIFSRIGIIDENLDYDDIRMYIEYQLGSLHTQDFSLLKESEIVKMYNEYHALLVALAKNFCTKTNLKCKECPVNKFCKHGAKILGKKVPSFDTRGSLPVFGGH